MYLKKFKLTNFRKFSNIENEIEFVDSEGLKLSPEGKINIATTTTLIVGKNNSGKTTIVEGLDKIVNNPTNFTSDDFNYNFLKSLLDEYLNERYDHVPYIEFILTIGLDKGEDDYVVNIAPFMTISGTNEELRIIVKYELKETALFLGRMKDYFNSNTISDDVDNTKCFYKLIKVINESQWTLKYYTENGQTVENFKLNRLIDFFKIKANTVTSDDCLSHAFNKIISARHKKGEGYNHDKIDNNIEKINRDLSTQFNNTHTKSVNETLAKVVNTDVKVNLSAELTFEKIFNKLVKYEYVENNNFIPENQFGLGYTNLMIIISKLVEYMESYPDDAFNSKINLIGIEEPETYMHPQLQELFISHINEAITTLLQENKKNINTQLIISTHSSHVLNSKIHNGGSFNNVNYISTEDMHSKIISLTDKKISNNGDTDSDELKFIKKHIGFKAIDIFFSDAVILVEGDAENILLPYFISVHDYLNKKGITIFQIDGAHAYVYDNLLKLLNIPSVIITDIDIERNKTEKENFKQIDTFENRTTTNITIKKYNNNSNKLDSIKDHFEDGNIYITFQNKINGFIPTSFEEALILTNYDNTVFNATLEKTTPIIYKNIVGENKDKSQNKNNSFKWQEKLANSKTKFANELLYQILINDNHMVNLPEYITNAFEYLKNKI